MFISGYWSPLQSPMHPPALRDHPSDHSTAHTSRGVGRSLCAPQLRIAAAGGESCEAVNYGYDAYYVP